MLSLAVFLSRLPYLAQSPPGGVPDALESLLAQWDKRVAETRDVHGVYEATYEDRVLGRNRVQHVEAWFVGPDLLRCDQSKLGSSESDQKSGAPIGGEGPQKVIVTVATSQSLTSYDFQSKKECDIDLAAFRKTFKKKGFWEGLLYGLVLAPTEDLRLVAVGLRKNELLAHFNARLLSKDQHFAYVEFRPKAEDHRSCDRVVVALNKADFVLKAARFYEPNGNYITYCVIKAERNSKAPLTAETIVRDLPKGWERYDFPSKER
jgi:hypothetical protein